MISTLQMRKLWLKEVKITRLVTKLVSGRIRMRTHSLNPNS